MFKLNSEHDRSKFLESACAIFESNQEDLFKNLQESSLENFKLGKIDADELSAYLNCKNLFEVVIVTASFHVLQTSPSEIPVSEFIEIIKRKTK